MTMLIVHSASNGLGGRIYFSVLASVQMANVRMASCASSKSRAKGEVPPNLEYLELG